MIGLDYVLKGKYFQGWVDFSIIFSSFWIENNFFLRFFLLFTFVYIHWDFKHNTIFQASLCENVSRYLDLDKFLKFKYEFV